METTRIFGDKEDEKFWSDKPIQKSNPNNKLKTKWYHIHLYTIPYNPIHKSPDGKISDVMNVVLYKCRCGKCKK